MPGTLNWVVHARHAPSYSVHACMLVMVYNVHYSVCREVIASEHHVLLLLQGIRPKPRKLALKCAQCSVAFNSRRVPTSAIHAEGTRRALRPVRTVYLRDCC